MHPETVDVKLLYKGINFAFTTRIVDHTRSIHLHASSMQVDLPSGQIRFWESSFWE